MSFFARLLGSASVPAPPRTSFDAGVAALARRRHADALAFFETALAEAETGPQRALVHNKRALTHLARGDRHAAVDAWCDALADDERCVPVLVNVGNALLEDGATDDAIVHYTAALRLDDAYAPGHLNLGIAYKRQGKRPEAVREFRRAARLEASLRRR